MSGLKTLRLSDGRSVPALGLGTWRMGEEAARHGAEVRAIRTALDLGMTLIDTAEIYGDGASETLVAEAIAGRRQDAFLVTKVAPSHADRRGVARSCEASLKRLGTDVIDLYLLHWIGGTPVGETVEAFERLKTEGKIGAWGVSNFDTDDMAELPGLAACQADQVLYNPQSRGIEYDLLPFCAERGITLMAYTPLGQNGKVLNAPAIRAVAGRHDATPAQIAIAWALRHPGVIVIPKSSSPQRVAENRAAAEIVLTPEDLAEIDRAFPAPKRKTPLDML